MLRGARLTINEKMLFVPMPKSYQIWEAKSVSPRKRKITLLNFGGAFIY
jgi:hypothetical protein